MAPRSVRRRDGIARLGSPDSGVSHAQPPDIAPPGSARNASDAAPDERLLAWVRAGGASALFLTLITDTGPGHSAVAETLAGAYLGYAVLILLVSRLRPEWVVRRVNATHAIDFAWTVAASTVGGGTGSHAFSFFAFVLAAAAFRWGLERAFVNALLVLAVGLLQDAAAETGLTPWAFESDHFLLQVSYISSGMAVLFGILADRLHHARQQASTIADLVSSITRATFLREAISTALVGIARAMEAATVVAVTEDSYTGTLTVWRAAPGRDGLDVTDEDVPRDQAAKWIAADGTTLRACEFRRRDPQADPVVGLCLQRRGAEGTCNANIVAGVRGASDWRKLLVVPFSAPNAWTGHVYVMDPASRPRGESRLRLLSDLVRQTTPALLNLYLLRRLRWRAESVERSRISRELHDTANQSLAAIGMRLDLLARHGADGSCPMTAEIRDLQALVRSVDLDLRESVSQPPQDLDAERLPIALMDIVGRFSRQSGIEAHLDWLAPRLNLPPQRCSEVARILQEALFNVRRHSRATRVAVRVEALPNGWALIVEDNGRGLGFTGRLSGNEPEMQLKGPRVIRERALALGGSIAIESSDNGARLELTFPQQR